MTEEDRESGFGFRIRPLPPKAALAERPATTAQAAAERRPSGRADTAAAARVEDDEPTSVASDTDTLPHTAGLFAQAQSALAFLGATAASGLATEASARRGPGRQFWVEAPTSWLAAASLVVNAGGRAYAGRGRDWSAVPADGTAPPAPGSRGGDDAIHLREDGGTRRLPLADWAEVGLAELLAAAPLRPGKPHSYDQVVVIAPGVLARTILRRALGQGFEVSVSSAQREPLTGGIAAGVSWLRIRWSTTGIPQSFLHALRRLPLVAVARPVGLGTEPDAMPSLLVDIQYAVPLSSVLIASMVPAGEQWLLGGPEVGHWRLHMLGRTTDAAEMIELPPVADAAAATPVQAASRHQTNLPLRLVQRTLPPGHPDVVLVDDDELGWLRDYLIGKPAAETTYLLLGPGRHLLLAPGGVLSALPFGVGLRRIGPGGVYLQEGRAMVPPLPETARAQAFPCEDGQVVAISHDRATDSLTVTRYALEALTPAWALWLGDAPAVTHGAGGGLAQAVLQLAEKLRPKPASRLRQVGERLLSPLGRRPTADRDQLLRAALRFEQQGRLAEAAQCMEKAGELAAAGRLYERAALGR